jgi:hypothetical protein
MYTSERLLMIVNLSSLLCYLTDESFEEATLIHYACLLPQLGREKGRRYSGGLPYSILSYAIPASRVLRHPTVRPLVHSNPTLTDIVTTSSRNGMQRLSYSSRHR